MHPPADRRLPRFTVAERWVHRATAALVGVLLATAAALYYEPVAIAVGRRPLVAGVHVVAGLLLPVPTLLGLLSPAFRADLSRLNRLTSVDRAWLRRRDRRVAGLPVGKFNGGQKVASAFVAGAGLVLFGSGLVLLGPVRVDVPVGWRQGATLVHDLLAAGLFVVLAGHVWQAYRHPEARAAMRTGSVDTAYASREHPQWAHEVADG
jgi:formate dehydrogenase subunit gamma